MQSFFASRFIVQTKTASNQKNSRSLRMFAQCFQSCTNSSKYRVVHEDVSIFEKVAIFIEKELKIIPFQ